MPEDEPRTQHPVKVGRICSDEKVLLKAMPKESESTHMDHRPRQAVADDNRAASSSTLDVSQLFLVAQPVVPLSDTAQPAYYEILLRERDEHGDISTPSVLTEDDDTAHEELDRWVLHATTSWLSECERAAASVNLTSASIRSGSGLKALRSAVEASGISPDRLMVELPEQLVSTDPDAFTSAVRTAAEIGARVAIDDLGSDRQALTTIRDVGVDAIKIDGFWVSKAVNDDLAEITIQSIVNAARLIGAQVVAEWIENEPTADLMRGMGIGFGQGWLFGYPQSLDQITADLARQPAAA